MRNYNKLHKAALDKQSNGPRHVWKNYLDDLLLIIVAGEPEATAESYTTPAREKQGAFVVAIDPPYTGRNVSEMKCGTNFNELFDRWQKADEVDAETIQLIKDTVRFMEETDDDIYADRCGDLLSGVYQIPSTPEEIGLIQDALDGSGTVPPPIELEDNGYGL